MIKGHGGNIDDLANQLGCCPSKILDMSSNVNFNGPFPGLLDYLRENIDRIVTLPQVDTADPIKSFARHHHLDWKNVMAGNGTTQIIYTIPRALGLKHPLIVSPTYSDYADSCRMNGVAPSFFITLPEDDFFPDLNKLNDAINSVDTVFFCNPNNPTGILVPKEDIRWICKKNPHTFFVIDESYLPFTHEGYQQSMIDFHLPNVMVLNSMSKIFRIPGLRIGFGVSTRLVIEKFSSYMLPWSVNSLAQAAVKYIMRANPEMDIFIENSKNFIHEEKKRFIEKLSVVSDLMVFPSETSFLLICLPEKHEAARVCESMAREKILIRNCSNFKGLSSQFIRIAMREKETNTLVAQKLVSILSK
jgi:threonine-phosphate decarboxylase